MTGPPPFPPTLSPPLLPLPLLPANVPTSSPPSPLLFSRLAGGPCRSCVDASALRPCRQASSTAFRSSFPLFLGRVSRKTPPAFGGTLPPQTACPTRPPAAGPPLFDRLPLSCSPCPFSLAPFCAHIRPPLPETSHGTVLLRGGEEPTPFFHSLPFPPSPSLFPAHTAQRPDPSRASNQARLLFLVRSARELFFFLPLVPTPYVPSPLPPRFPPEPSSGRRWKRRDERRATEGLKTKRESVAAFLSIACAREREQNGVRPSRRTTKRPNVQTRGWARARARAPGSPGRQIFGPVEIAPDGNARSAL